MARITSTVSGSIASFNSPGKVPINHLKVNMLPKQELYGMDGPYPAGASKNLIPDGTDTNNGYISNKYLTNDGATTTSVYTYVSEYFPVTAGADYMFSAKVSTTNLSICFYDENKTFISGVNVNGQLSQQITVPTGAVYARSSQYKKESYYSSGNILQFELGTTATTPMWYSNVCPISGASELNIHKDGANLINLTSDLIFGFVGTGTLSDGILTSSSNTCQIGILFPVIEGVTYHVGYTRVTGGTSYARIATYSAIPTEYEDVSRVRVILGTKQTENKEYHTTCTIQQGEKYLYISCYKSSSAAVFSLKDFYARTDGVYEFAPYQEDIIPVTFPALGKNLIPNGTNTENGFVDNKYLDYLGGYGNSESLYVSEYFSVQSNTVYTYSNNSRANYSAVCFYDSNKTYIVGHKFALQPSITITSPSNAVYARASAYKTEGYYCQLELGSTATDYEPYTNTLYGGVLDIVSGILTVTWLYRNLGIFTWTKGTSSNYTWFYTTVGKTGGYNYICSHYRTVQKMRTELPNRSMGLYANTSAYWKRIVIRDDDYADYTVAQFKEAMNGVYAAYEIEEPQTFQLSTQQLATFKGRNNIWSDAGSTEVNYDYCESVDILKERKKMIFDAPHLETATGDFITFTTDIEAPIEIIGQGNITITGKNMLNPATLIDPNPFTSEGITFSMDSEGVVTVNGIAGDTTSPQYRFVWDLLFSADCYFCANAPCTTTYAETYVYNNTLGKRFTKWDGVTSCQSSASNRVLSEAKLIEGYRAGFNIRISRGTGKEFVNDKFYPMLLPGSCTDTTFEPYKGITQAIGSNFKSFKGINCIWSDSGSPITIKYWKH